METSVSLIIPRGIEPDIFPWGVNLIADYVSAQGFDVTLVDLLNDSDIDDLFSDYNHIADEIRLSLKPNAARNFVGFTYFKDSFLATLAEVGPAFLDIADSKGFLSSGFDLREQRNRLSTFHSSYWSLMEGKFQHFLSEDRRWLAGITTFDHTVFPTLILAEWLKKTYRLEGLVLGGDYWDFDNACNAMESLSWLDGIVVGYGEKTVVELARAINEGRSVRTHKIPGLVNDATIELNEEKRFFVRPRDLNENKDNVVKLRTFNVPEAYRDKDSFAQFRLARPSKKQEGVYHVLTQRGCSFGACRFCTQIDKFIHFEFSIHEVVKQLDKLLEQAGASTEGIKINVDNDEMTAKDLVVFIEQLDKIEARRKLNIREVIFWYQVKLFNDDIARTLARSPNPEKYLFKMNWESLNPKTLKTMSKGHNPLQAIASCKGVLDAGGRVTTQYMIYFPKEDNASVSQEVEYLRRSEHLIGSKRFGGHYFPYLATRRDEVCRRPEKHGIRVWRRSENVWLKEHMGVDLDISNWQYDYEVVRTRNLDTWVAWAWHQLLHQSLQRRVRTVEIMSTRPPETKRPEDSLRGKASKVRRVPIVSSIRFFLLRTPIVASTRFFLLAVTTFRFAYIRRLRLINRYIFGRRLGNLRISERQLVMNSQRRNLGERELMLLRALYFPRRLKELCSMLHDSVSADEIKGILQDMTECGAVLTYKDQYVSVVNDPDYLLDQAHAEGVAGQRQEYLRPEARRRASG